MGLTRSMMRRPRAYMAGIATAMMLGVALPGTALAQGADPAEMQVRITQLEEQVRQLSGQVEGLQFQMTQLQTLVERMQEDVDFRFQQLEGGASGEAQAAAPGSDSAASLPPESTSEGAASGSDDVLQGDEDLMGAQSMGTEDNLYASDVFGDEAGADADGAESGQQLGGAPAPLGQTEPSAPLDLSLETAEKAGDPDATAQYQAAYDAVVSGDYGFAEEQFRQFLDLYPDAPQVPDATYWLGESLIRQEAYDEAANTLLTGFEDYPDSTRAPDFLFKLGVALNGAGEFETACQTYSEVLRRYPDTSDAFRERVSEEQTRAGC